MKIELNEIKVVESDKRKKHKAQGKEQEMSIQMFQKMVNKLKFDKLKLI